MLAIVGHQVVGGVALPVFPQHNVHHPLYDCKWGYTKNRCTSKSNGTTQGCKIVDLDLKLFACPDPDPQFNSGSGSQSSPQLSSK